MIEPGKHCLCKSAEHSILIFVHFQSGTWQIQFMVILATLKQIYVHQQKSKWFFKGYPSKTISIGILYLSEFLPHLSQRLKMSISDGKISGIRLSVHAYITNFNMFDFLFRSCAHGHLVTKLPTNVSLNLMKCIFFEQFDIQDGNSVP